MILIAKKKVQDFGNLCIALLSLALTGSTIVVSLFPALIGETSFTMNISQPVPSAIGSVDFGFLSSAEIKALSVKKIQNSLTFDTLLHPVPGGLYDPALGAWGDITYELLKLGFNLQLT